MTEKYSSVEDRFRKVEMVRFSDPTIYSPPPSTVESRSIYTEGLSGNTAKAHIWLLPARLLTLN